LTDSETVRIAYDDEIQSIARYLASDLSVLVMCDKVLVEHIYRHVVRQSGKRPLVEGEEPSSSAPQRGLGGAPPQERVALTGAQRIYAIWTLLEQAKRDHVVILRHLDVLAGGNSDGSLTTDARMLTEVLYHSSQSGTPTLLGFIDPSLGLPKVLTDRFAVRVEVAGLSREIITHLITESEYRRFEVFDQEMLFKNVSGFNAIQFRNAMRYLSATSTPGTPTRRLLELIRQFKRGSSDKVEIPDVTFDDIGGYARVKEQLFEAIELITGSPVAFHADGSPAPPTLPAAHPETEEDRARRRKLAPRGFIFHGPPGTGKTLFAKAVANVMNATIQTVSGPEIMDMWVGKSESNLRRIFTTARRNAPAVIFFDEFDSIAVQRSGLADGGSRASNAVVAQLLTELDGFHDDQDILVIGTTNRLDIIDEALLRPSRFQPIEIGLPDTDERRQIAAIHMRAFDIPAVEVVEDDPTLLDDQNRLFDVIAQETADCNGDEIRAIFQHVARRVRRGEPISLETFRGEIAYIHARRQSHHN
jgi:hypothetical protein